MKFAISLLTLLALFPATGSSQGAKPTDIGASTQPVGDPGVMWYTTWDTARAEAIRSNRPIFFMAAAATCSNIPGVF
ncbi:hypothetical protein VSU19_08600 [Verrucomicrobiales bacterium BCK34]|nr:hypothetical protein [Verrucomicrobiales bacterium BCK34]